MLDLPLPFAPNTTVMRFVKVSWSVGSSSLKFENAESASRKSPVGVAASESIVAAPGRIGR
jgi:hypothetical protein